MIILQLPRNARVRVVGVLLLDLSEVAGRALPPRGSREDAEPPPIRIRLVILLFIRAFAGGLVRRVAALPLLDLAVPRAFRFHSRDLYRGRAARGNWTRSLEELEKRVAAYQFDVALLSCGSYGLPLGHYITHGLGATAIYVGGALQLFFGLRGLRWKREIAPYESDAWACPERPKWDTSGMENYGLGPYWCPPAKGGS